MKIKVNQETCIGCGICIDICPEVFKYNDAGKSESVVEEITNEHKEKVRESIDVCPMNAIEAAKEDSE